MKIAIIPGRFQGVTIAHEEIIRDASLSCDRVVIVIIDGEKSSKDKVKNPLSAFTRKMLLLDVIKDLDNVDIITYKSAYLQDMLDFIAIIFGLDRISDELIIVCGGDRVNSYSNQIKNVVGFRSIVLRDYLRNSDISATMLRSSILNNDYDSFLKISPKILHNHFFVLHSILTSGPCNYI